MRTPPASLGCTKLTRLFAVPVRGASYKQAQPAGPKLRACRLDIGDGEGELLDAGATAIDELGDRRLLVQGGQQLDLGGAVADNEHGLAHALLLVGLFVDADDAERPAVELDRGVEVGHGDPDVVDPAE